MKNSGNRTDIALGSSQIRSAMPKTANGGRVVVGDSAMPKSAQPLAVNPNIGRVGGSAQPAAAPNKNVAPTTPPSKND